MVALTIVFMLLFTAIGVRMTQLQVFSSDRLSAMGEETRIRSVKLTAGRGSIFDRNGNELAISVPQKTVWADPKLVEDPFKTAALLAPILGKQQGDLQELLMKQGRFVYLQRKIEDEKAKQIQELKLPGIAMYDEPKRFLPEGGLLSSVIGNVDIDDKGLSGLESQYGDKLSGKPGTMVVEQDPSGGDIPGGMRSTQEPVRGDDLVLTIDRDLQFKVESALADEIKKANARGGISAVMDTKTGEILAVANLEVPNGKFGTPVEPAPNNMALTNVYEPGSVNKLITIAGAVEEGLISPTSSMVVPNSIKVSDSVFKEHEDHPVVPFSTTDIVANSSNVGTIMIAQKLGKERLDKYMREFGLGKSTGLDFPGESRGLMLDPKKYSGSSLPTIAIGQGISVTAIQMLAAYNTIANDGLYIEPKLVKATIDKDGEEHETEASQTKQVVSQQTANQMSAMLKEVVRVGTGTAAQIDGYDVAGKTGTARKPKTNGSGYQEGAYVSSFAGFVPAEEPRLTMIVMLDQPTPIYGGLVAAPVFGDIGRYALQAFRIPPVPSAADNHGVPLVTSQNASSVGEADAPAGTTKEEADSVKANTNQTSGGASSSTSSSSTSSSTTTPTRRSSSTSSTTIASSGR